MSEKISLDSSVRISNLLLPLRQKSNNDTNKMNKKLLNNSKRWYTRAFSGNTIVHVHWFSGFV